MWARKRLDLGWSDLAFGARKCLTVDDRPTLLRQVETTWSKEPDAFACLSVRSGFDLLLKALALPAESEVLVSALTIRDMTRIIEHHGLTPVPVDLDIDTMSPDLARLENAVTPRTRAILVAHLFGGRAKLGPLLAFAERRGLLVIEDCAQAFAGSDFSGHPEANVSMFSFGPIKTATALGGAVLNVRDPRVLARMRELHAAYPTQGRGTYFKRVAKYSALKAISGRWFYGYFTRFCGWLGKDYDRVVNGAVRGFAGDGFFERIRKQPSAPLLALLARRLSNFPDREIRNRRQLGRDLANMLANSVRSPSSESSPHHYWVFPIITADPDRVIAALRREGFDATQGQSLCVVDPPKDRAALEPVNARLTIAKLVYLPCYPGMPESSFRDIARIVNDHVVPVVYPPASPVELDVDSTNLEEAPLRAIELSLPSHALAPEMT